MIIGCGLIFWQWIQHENLLNVLPIGVEGWSLEWRSWSFVPMVVGKLDQGVGAPFQWVPVNGIRGLELPSNGCWRKSKGCSFLQVGAYVLVWLRANTRLEEVILYIKNKIEMTKQLFFPTLGFHLKSLCSCVMIMCDGLFFITSHDYYLFNY